jgi:outer membrane receptor protein involved in Fe transport
MMRLSLLALAAALASAPVACAQTQPPPASVSSVVVIGATPLPGSGVDRDQVPQTTFVLGPEDIDRTGIASLTGAILEGVPSATVNDTEGNVFQPDILFRGFTASPVAGTPEGLAVYVNGARFNDAFGDIVDWDLIPPSAIASATIEASNPLFGLNALGGSVNVRMKSGFTAPGADLTAYGGSYGRASASLEDASQSGPFAVYMAADVTHDDGFRQTSASQLERGYVDLGWRDDAGEAHLGLTAADDTLGNPGATPIQALAANISNIFTAPNAVHNQYFAANLNGSHQLGAGASLQAVAYYQTLTQNIPNGITEEVEPCDDGTGLLCNDDGTYVTGLGGKLVPDFLHGATYSGLSVQTLTTEAYGASGEIAGDARLIGHANHLVAGLSYDGSDSLFAGSQAIGGFNPYTREFIGPGVVQDQPSEGVNPVRVLSLTRSLGVFATDALTLAPGLDLNLAGRFNDARIDLKDELGGPVNGRHAYDRLNPGAGLDYALAPWLQLYGSYVETNRAPTPEELSCASAAAPCSLLNFFVGDPNLKQVVARTVEAGLRGSVAKLADGRLSWTVDVYRTANTDDIIYETTLYNPNLAYYTNAGRTLRQGLEADLRFVAPRLRASLGYAFTDATFQTPLLLGSGSNPRANADGEIEVLPGDRIPGIPRHRVDLTLDYDATSQWTLGGSVTAQSSAYRFGDEANLTAPLPGYLVVDLDTQFRLSRRITLFAVLNNAFDARYDTYGSFGPVGDVPWPNVPGGVTDPRTASPGTPISVYGGVRIAL